MSTEEQYLIAGRVLSEYAENRRELAALQHKAAAWRRAFTRVTGGLSGGVLNADVRKLFEEALREMPTREEIASLVNEIESVSDRRHELVRLLRDMGCEPKD